MPRSNTLAACWIVKLSGRETTEWKARYHCDGVFSDGLLGLLGGDFLIMRIAWLSEGNDLRCLI
ncbi:MAG: hypothetical protein HC877_12435 [Thioploca sp.]|nr:hypothetical protein [Thioploca sp.]